MTLLSLEEARRLIKGASDDDADLASMLAAAERAIDEEYGPLTDYGSPEPVVEDRRPRGPLIMLARRASDILSVLERSTYLDPEDYALRPSANILVRMADTLPTPWRGHVTVTYHPMSDLDDRKRVQAALVRLSISFAPNVTSQQIGPWTETYGQGNGYSEQRAAILASLGPSSAGVW